MTTDGVSATSGRARARRRLLVAGVLVLGAGATAAVLLAGTSGSPGPSASPAPSAAPVTQSGALPLCGFPRLEQVTDDGVDAGDLGGIRTVVDDVVTLDDGDLVTFRVLDGAAYVLEWDREATYTVTRYDLATGDVEATTPVALDR